MADPEVTERPDNLEVSVPTLPHTLVSPFDFLADHHKSLDRTALIILNQPINKINFEKTWASTKLHICADGGANRLYDRFDSEQERSSYIPQFIVGDFDSLKDSTKQYYSEKGTVIIHQETQYSTDFMKAIVIVQLYFHSAKSRSTLTEAIDNHDGLAETLKTYKIDVVNEETVRLYILGGIGGRFDQTIHSISQLYSMNKSIPYLQQFFITEDDLVFLVKKGLNYVSYPSKSVFHSDVVPTCGLLPLGNTSVVLNTYGLRYDVKNWPSSMGGNVSSSNGICGTTGFTVDTTDDLVINIEIEHFD